jgi:ectoine hydroxylase-related dioxygenase (phytanoyl-CoA dioxygenase family)
VPDLYADGFSIAEIQLTREQCDHLAASIPSVAAGRGGVRGLVTHPSVLQLLMHEQLGKYLWSVIGRDLVAVKATLFDKTSDSNWRVQWHQDRVVAVRERMDVAGYGPWSVKAGVPHVEPPASVLEQMLAVRVYLDDCGAENGPLRVIPGSHTSGKLDEADIESHVAAIPAVELNLRKGAMLLMRPLLLHASSPALVASHRRVLHIEFAPPEAVSPLQFEATVQLRRAA